MVLMNAADIYSLFIYLNIIIPYYNNNKYNLLINENSKILIIN